MATITKHSLVIFFLVFLPFSTPQAPPPYWLEHWFEHVQNLSRVFTDGDVAIYFDSDVDRSIIWPNTFVGDVWRYVRSVYGSFGPTNDLYAIFHTGKYSGGHPSSYFDPSHDNRNVIDVGSSSPTAWLSGSGNDLDIVTHEIAHVVEGACKGVHNSPAFPIWGDSKWAEIFNYDVYINLGMEEDANRWYEMMIRGSDNFPSPNTYWFRDWFYPIYYLYGGKLVLNNFFQVLALHFPQQNNAYTRDMNFGEFVHFWSGASGVDLKPLATMAFGWNEERESQLTTAKIEFANINYN